MDNKKNGLFNIGDEVITSDGRKGKIVDICYCENCELFKPFEYRVDGEKKVICTASAKCKRLYEYLKTQLNENDDR